MASPAVRPEHHGFTKAVARALRERCGVTTGTRLIVATSGGSDSVALLRALAALAPRRTWQLHLAVGHVQHHLREAKLAEADSQFVADLAGELDLPFLRADLAPPRRPRNREAWAGQARYAALAEMAMAFGAQAIVTAHQADDQLETLLMRLLRGASVAGMAGMAWRRRLGREELREVEKKPKLKKRGVVRKEVASFDTALPRPWVLRPMLGLDRAAVARFLADISQPWREDHTNQDLTRLRARLRHDVLPVLREIRADAPARAVALGDHLRGMAKLLGNCVTLAADRVTLVDGQDVIDRADARLLQPIVLFGLLRRLLIRAGAGRDRLGARALNPIVRAVRDTRGGERRFDLGGARVVIRREVVTVHPTV